MHHPTAPRSDARPKARGGAHHEGAGVPRPSPRSERRADDALRALGGRHATGIHAPLQQEEPFLPLDEWLFDIIIDGGGGCGKTMLINHFFVPLCRAFFRHAGVVLAAPTNKAARGIHAKTLHCVLGFTPESSLRTSALALTTQKRVKLERTCIPAGAVIEDEFSMIAGSMNHAASLLFTYAREGTYRLRREDYAQPRERYGRVPILAWAGDHLQLPPAPKKNSLLAPLQSTSQEHRVGASIFRMLSMCFRCAR